ncbi:MAG: hypothetical protein NT080_04095 [Spirochaetes bacterium]|nr:hypothetical protein [Spirochaetota bacterium]
MPRYEYVEFGRQLRAAEPGKLYLDVGNDLAPGVVDHHHRDDATSAAELVVRRPGLVTGWIPPGADDWTIVVHRYPDLDCACAAYFAEKLVREGRLPEGADRIAEYVTGVDQGRFGEIDADHPGIYETFAVLVDALELPMPERWDETMRIGRRILDFALSKARNFGSAGLPGNLFDDAPEEFRAARDQLREDRAAYLADVTDLDKFRIMTARLPRERSGSVEETDGVVWTAPSPKFFKLWARTDLARSSRGRGFRFLYVVWPGGCDGRDRHVLSVDPYSGCDLRGLGAALNRLEAAARARMGVVIDGPPRDGYDIADPWYDGRGHDYTIVDAPSRGTELEPEEIENVLASFNELEAFSRTSCSRVVIDLLYRLDAPEPSGAARRPASRRRAPKADTTALPDARWTKPASTAGYDFSEPFRIALESAASDSSRSPARALRTEALPESPEEGFRLVALEAVFPRWAQPLVLVRLESCPRDGGRGRGVPAMDARSVFALRHDLETGEADAVACAVLGAFPEWPAEGRVSLVDSSWLVEFADSRVSRIGDYFDALCSAFVAGDAEPTAAVAAVGFDPLSGVERIGRRCVIAVQSDLKALLYESRDPETPAAAVRRMRDAWLGAGREAMREARLRKQLLDAAQARLAAVAAAGHGPARTSRELGTLQDILVAYRADRYFTEVSDDPNVAGIWKLATSCLDLDAALERLSDSVSALKDHTDTRRRAYIERFIYAATILFLPATLFTDYVGAILFDRFPFASQAVAIVLSGYAVLGFAVLGFFLVDRRRGKR